MGKTFRRVTEAVRATAGLALACASGQVNAACSSPPAPARSWCCDACMRRCCKACSCCMYRSTSRFSPPPMPGMRPCSRRRLTSHSTSAPLRRTCVPWRGSWQARKGRAGQHRQPAHVTALNPHARCGMIQQPVKAAPHAKLLFAVACSGHPAGQGPVNTWLWLCLSLDQPCTTCAIFAHCRPVLQPA